MARTLADMKARIAAEIFRDDLSAEIANAINDAIIVYQGERLYFNEPNLRNPLTFTTVNDQATYTAADDPGIATLYNIDFLTYVQGGSTFKVYRASPEEVQLDLQGSYVKGPPDKFTYYGQSITLYPRPDAAYVINLFGHLNVDGPTDDNDATNVWMNDAERLIRSRAKYELAVHVTRNQGMVAAMSPDTGATARAFQELKSQTNRVTSLGRISAMQF